VPVRSYKMFWTITGQPPGGISVTADIPADWKETLDGMDSPTFTVPGVDGALIAFAAIHAPGASDAERLEWAMRQQFDAQLPKVERQPRGDGRVWAVLRGSGSLHARMFLPAPEDSVVMATFMAFSPPAGGALPRIERVFDSVRVTPAS
jgi:hypothetical protein